MIISACYTLIAYSDE